MDLIQPAMIEHIRQSSLLTRVFARAIIVQRNEEVICNVTRFSRVKSMATNVPSSIPTLDGDGNAGFERERKEEKRRHMLTMMEKRCYSANCTFKSFILLRFFDRCFHAQQYKA
jgi:hypothetical protein